jgi:hypothetical protein
MQESRSRGNTAGTGRRACPKNAEEHAPRSGGLQTCAGWRPKLMSGCILEAGSEPHAKHLKEEQKTTAGTVCAVERPWKSYSGAGNTQDTAGDRGQTPGAAVRRFNDAGRKSAASRDKNSRGETQDETAGGRGGRRRDGAPPDRPEQTCEGTNPMSVGGSKKPAQAAR